MHHATLQPRTDKGNTMLHIALKTIREYKQLSEAEMGQLLGYEEQSVKGIEDLTVSPSLNILQVYSSALDIPVSGIVYISERLKDKQAAIDRFKAELENPDRAEVIELTRCTDLNLSLVVGAPLVYPNKAVQDILDYIDDITNRTPLQNVILAIENLKDVEEFYRKYGYIMQPYEWGEVAKLIELEAIRDPITKTIAKVDFSTEQLKIFQDLETKGKARLEIIDGKVKRDKDPCILKAFFGKTGATLIADKIDQAIVRTKIKN